MLGEQTDLPKNVVSTAYEKGEREVRVETMGNAIRILLTWEYVALGEKDRSNFHASLLDILLWSPMLHWQSVRLSVTHMLFVICQQCIVVLLRIV